MELNLLLRTMKFFLGVEKRVESEILPQRRCPGPLLSNNIKSNKRLFNNYSSRITRGQLVGKNFESKKNVSLLKLDFNPFFAAKNPALFATYSLVVAQPIRTQH